MQEIENVDRRKCFAVRILADHWAGVPMPLELVLEAQRIQAEMILDGTWASA